MRVWEGFEREGLYVYLRLIHRVLQRELAQRRKAVILQLKKKNRKTKTRKAEGSRAYSETLYQANPFPPPLPAPPNMGEPAPLHASTCCSRHADLSLSLFRNEVGSGLPLLLSCFWNMGRDGFVFLFCSLWLASVTSRRYKVTGALSGWRAKALMSMMGFWGHKGLKWKSEGNLTWASGFVCCCFQPRRRSCQGRGSWRCRLEGWTDPCLWMCLKLAWQYSLDFKGELKYPFSKKYLFIWLHQFLVGAYGLFNCSM